MTHRFISCLMSAVTVASVITLLLVGGVVIPRLETGGLLPAGSSIGFAFGSAPLLITAAVSLRLFFAIGTGEVFTRTNARRITTMGIFSVISAFVWCVEFILVVCVVPLPKPSVISTVCVAFIITAALSASCIALGLLCRHAASIKDENDLTV